ncbi:MAG TPA: AsmA-like C-terminal region-containing protein, partial [Vicinamibacterales bacterium]|nr:AsmA-like C-terminal region-containing protein [Vicinamibacterales bacterium]
IVDGTKGDVELKRVDIIMSKSRLLATGRVEGTKGIKGKRIIVNVKSSATDLSELLRLVSKAGRPVADGVLTIDAAMDLPQGRQPVLERLSLAGSVRADRLTFTNDAVQDKIDELSRRGRGKPGDETINDVASKMVTTFTLEKGVAVYRNFAFAVRGATIRLDGTHSLKTKAVDLSGAVLLNASISNTQTGFKSWVLKPFDALFRKGGAGSRLAITVQGTQDQPKLEFDFKRTLKGS